MERIDDDGIYREYHYERWITDDSQVLRVLFDGERVDELAQIAELTRLWIGPVHARLATTIAVLVVGTKLHVLVEDDRGPTFAEAAATLVDRIERERWSVAQVIGLCEAITAMRERVPVVKLAIAETDLFVDVAGHVKLKAHAPHVDNGRASTRAGGPPPAGVVSFLSPELCMNQPPTGASDVFVLASHLYTALSGRYAFHDENSLTTIMLILQQPLPPIATYATGLNEVIARAMDKTPDWRYRSTVAFADELRRVVPDAADYDAVISDRIVLWRATKLSP